MPELITLLPLAGEPELSDPRITGEFAKEMEAIASETQVPPWCGYIARRAGSPAGFGGFKTPPDEAGAVEIGYLTFPNHANTGVAKAVAAKLIAIARSNGATAVIAHTLCEDNPSTAVLRANSFARDGVSFDPDEGEVWRWCLFL